MLESAPGLRASPHVTRGVCYAFFAYEVILFDRDPDDVRDVLEFANVELLEMRFLDQHSTTRSTRRTRRSRARRGASSAPAPRVPIYGASAVSRGCRSDNRGKLS